MVEKFAPYAKAIVAGLSGGVFALAGVVQGAATLGDVTTAEWLIVATAVLSSTGITWLVPNGTAK